MGDRITVLNPMGFPPEVTRKKPLAPRLDTLDGKTVYLVDCRFDDSDVFLQADAGVVRRAHARGPDGLQADLERLPQGRSGDLGGDQGAGPRRDRRRRPLKHLRAGGRRARDDDRGAVRGAHRRHAHRQVRPGGPLGRRGERDARASGRCSCPQPVMGKTAAELRAYVDGPGSDHRAARSCRRSSRGSRGRSTSRSAGRSSSTASTPRLVEADTEDNLHRLFLDNRWTDMLPIVLPTEERVAAMLAARAASPTRSSGACARRTSAKRGSTPSRRSR